MDLEMCISVSFLVNLREILHEQTFEAWPQLELALPIDYSGQEYCQW